MKIIVKTIIGLSLITLLISQVNPHELEIIIGNIRDQYLIVGIVFFVFASVFEVLKLYSLLHRYCNLFATIKIVYTGLFFNNFLPSNIGGDAYRIYMLKKYRYDLGAAITPIFLDRITGLVILIFAALLYSILNYSVLQSLLVTNDFVIKSGYILWASLVFLGLSIGIGVCVRRRAGWFHKLVLQLTAFFNQCKQALSDITIGDRMLLVTFSSGFHLCRIFGFYYFVLCFNAYIDWDSLFLILAVVALISVLPISIGALGVREGAIVLMLNFYGVEITIAVAVALLVLLILWLKSLIGGIFFILAR